MQMIEYALERRVYVIKAIEGDGLEHLASFLWHHELRGFNFKWWVLNSDAVVDMDIWHIYKDKNYVYILMKNASDTSSFKIEQSQLLMLIDAWRQVQISRPRKVIISCVNGEWIVRKENCSNVRESVFDNHFWPDEPNNAFVGAVLFEMAPWGQYTWEDQYLLPFTILAQFLRSDVLLLGTDFYKKWLLDADRLELVGDVSLLRKSGDFVLIKDIFCLFDKEEHFAMSYGQFLKLLEDWDIFVRCRIQKIEAYICCGNVIFDAPDDCDEIEKNAIDFIEFELFGDAYIPVAMRGFGVHYLSSFLSAIGKSAFNIKWWATESFLPTIGAGEDVIIHKVEGFIEITIGEAIATLTGYILTQQMFVQLLDDWRDIQRLRPQKIRVACIGGKCFVRGKDFSKDLYFDARYWPASPSGLLSGAVELKANLWGRYGWREQEQKELNLVAQFLADDVTWTGTQRYREWVFNDDVLEFSGEQTLLKKVGNFIVIKNEQMLSGNDAYIAMLGDQFLNMLERWDILIQDPSEKVLMHCKNGDVTFEWIK